MQCTHRLICLVLTIAVQILTTAVLSAGPSSSKNKLMLRHGSKTDAEESQSDSTGWKASLKNDIQAHWTVTKLGWDRLRITEPGTVFVLKRDGIVGDLATDSTFTKNTVEGGRVLAPKGIVPFLQNKKTSREFRSGEKVYLWKTGVGDDYIGLFLVSYDTYAAAERGGRTSQTRYKAYVAFKFDKGDLEKATFAQLKDTITDVLAPDADVQAASTKTISLGQTTKDVEAVLGRPERIIDLGPKVTYIYKDMKVIFRDGKVSDVQ